MSITCRYNDDDDHNNNNELSNVCMGVNKKLITLSPEVLFNSYFSKKFGY
jgi:hypothetical protein